MAQRRTPGLRKRGRIWHIDKQIRGYGKIYESTGTSDLEEAERYLNHRLQEIRLVQRYGERPNVTFSEAAAKFLEENQHLRSLNRTRLAFDKVMPYIGELTLEQVHMDSLACYVRAKRSAGSKVATINRDLAAVRRVLNLAARKWRHSNGMSYLSTPALLENPLELWRLIALSGALDQPELTQRL